MLSPSLWFNAWRCKCSEREKDFPQLGQVQANFFNPGSEFGGAIDLDFSLLESSLPYEIASVDEGPYQVVRLKQVKVEAT